jgi:hypothetical protein
MWVVEWVGKNLRGQEGQEGQEGQVLVSFMAALLDFIEVGGVDGRTPAG